MKQNQICAGNDDICMICTVGDNLENDAKCKHINLLHENDCPKFECAEQCRFCSLDCEFYKR